MTDLSNAEIEIKDADAGSNPPTRGTLATFVKVNEDGMSGPEVLEMLSALLKGETYRIGGLSGHYVDVKLVTPVIAAFDPCEIDTLRSICDFHADDDWVGDKAPYDVEAFARFRDRLEAYFAEPTKLLGLR